MADSVLEWCKVQKARGDGIEPYFSQVLKEMKEKHWPVPGAVRAKFYKLAGDQATDAGQLESALAFFIKAMELDPRRAKCTTRIDKIRQKLNRAESAVSPGNDSPPAAGALAGGVQAESLKTPESQGEPALTQNCGDTKNTNNDTSNTNKRYPEYSIFFGRG